MNVEDVQNFVSEIVNFCKDNTIYGELVPIDPIYELDIQPEDIEYIKKFVKNNPIVTFPSNIRYKKSVNFSGHTFLNASYNKPDEVKQKDQIFMPTWILTTIILSRLVRDLSARSVFDFGSGDGRIQYFASSIGLRTYGIEYSDILVNVQKQIAEKTGVELGVIKGDVLEKRDYSIYDLEKPAFIISFTEGMRERTFDFLKSSLEQYTPDLIKKSIFVTIHENISPLRKEIIFDSENFLDEIYNLNLPTYWNKETNYRINTFKT